MHSLWTNIDPSQPCFKFYDIGLDHDLFDAYVVSCEWGRIGAKNFRRKVAVFNSVDEAMTQLKH
ncbi:WGR domain-containing protein, partial [Agitococcus lubricus]